MASYLDLDLKYVAVFRVPQLSSIPKSVIVLVVFVVFVIMRAENRSRMRGLKGAELWNRLASVGRVTCVRACNG